MEKKKYKFSKRIFALILILALLFLSVFFFVEILLFSVSDSTSKSSTEDLRSFHIVVTGSYENQLFLQQVYQGALKQADYNSALIELYVPQSLSSNLSLQELLNYCVYVNADGIIAYIDSPDEQIQLLQRSEGYEIPLITTGQFAPGVHQTSFIGCGYWELGKKVADETLYLLGERGSVYVINEFLSANSNYNNLINAMQTALLSYSDIKIQVLEELREETPIGTIKTEQDSRENASDNTSESPDLFVCLTEESTIRTALLLRDEYPQGNYKLIGFGSNETCQSYLQKGLITELISLDPEKIGEAAITELFEYRNKGYANSYISADVKITRAAK